MIKWNWNGKGNDLANVRGGKNYFKKRKQLHELDSNVIFVAIIQELL